tara:strand:+ start:353 stop:487 length:135 start_codon:yes stop_codon:yes gene_type:complete
VVTRVRRGLKVSKGRPATLASPVYKDPREIKVIKETRVLRGFKG